jgi:hypothetical protein
MNKEKMCLVIMPFCKELQEVYEYSIKPSVIDAGYCCIRVDELMGQVNITKSIIEHIFMANIIIADLTGNNPNVFYELGVAHAISNKTIMLTQDIQTAPFDIKSYRVIQYDQTVQGAHILREKLTKEIQHFDEWRNSATNPVQDYGTGDIRVKWDHFQYVRNSSPVVVKTIPESGATDVDPTLAEVQVTFSKKMFTHSWSWCSAGGNYPGTTKENPRFLKDNKTCVLKVKLEPDMRYHVWINLPPEYMSFRDLDNNPAVPYLLTFETKSM